MRKKVPTKSAVMLNEALHHVGVKSSLEHYDGHKHIDICVPDGNIYIEVDGPQHYTSAKQIVTDFKRDYYSRRDGFFTLHVANEIVEKDPMPIARAIKKIIKQKEKAIQDK